MKPFNIYLKNPVYFFDSLGLDRPFSAKNNILEKDKDMEHPKGSTIVYLQENSFAKWHAVLSPQEPPASTKRVVAEAFYV